MAATPNRKSVLVCLADPDARRAAEEALARRFEVVAASPSDGAEDAASAPDAYARRSLDAWIRDGRAAVVLDYVADDAASVKFLQTATDRPDAPRFVFVLPPSAEAADGDRAQWLMAMNEGASAILPSPLDGESLAVYVDRAVNGPSRWRNERTMGEEEVRKSVALEERVRALRESLKACERLVSRLLSTPASSQARRVMVVSDSSFQREQLERLLTEHGFSVLTADTPEGAVEKALAEKPRVIISDLEMDGMDGVALCRQLKIEHKLIPCYFVICTASRERIPQVMAPGNGVDDCVPKPSGSAEILEFITRVAMGLLL